MSVAKQGSPRARFSVCDDLNLLRGVGHLESLSRSTTVERSRKQFARVLGKAVHRTVSLLTVQMVTWRSAL